MTRCSHCGASVADNEKDCPSCGQHHGFPNVKMAEAELEALEARVVRAADDARARGCEEKLRDFELACERAQAVANVDVGFLHQFLSSDKSLYAPYSRLVHGGVRRPAGPAEDRHRAGAEGVLFGTCGRDISYAALSLDGAGLRSYGSVTLELREKAIEERASVLEENSFGFVSRHAMVPGGTTPLGYRATWISRAKLALAKLACRIHSSTQSNAFPSLLLSQGSGELARAGDDFVEVHIFGGFNQQAIKHVRVMDPPTREPDRVLLEAAREDAARKGIEWL